MATLEKIRSQKKLLVGVIFGALLLFIVSIIDNPASLLHRDENVAAKVDGSKITIEQIQERAATYQGRSQSYDSEFQALNELISQKLLENEYDRLGIGVTDAEISEIIGGENVSPMVLNMFNNAFGASPAEVYAMISNPAAYGIDQNTANALAAQFKTIEDNLRDQVKYNKLQNMVLGAINANKLDTRYIHDEAASTYKLAYVSQPVANAAGAVTDDEVRAYYDEHRADFKLEEPKRHVRYVMLDITPGDADRREAYDLVHNALERVNAGLETVDDLGSEGVFDVNRVSLTKADLAQITDFPGLNMFLSQAADGDATVLETGDMYRPSLNIVKLVSHENKVNGATVNYVFLDGTVMPDSVMAQLNAGNDPESLAGIAQVAPVPVRFDQIDRTIGAANLDSLRAIGEGRYYMVNDGGGRNIALSIQSYDEPVEVFDFYVAAHEIVPSRQTLEALNSRMREFLITAPTAEDFNVDNAGAQGLRIENAIIGESSANLGNGYEDSQDMVAWALNANPGKVSNLIMSRSGDRMGAIAVVDKFSDYLPANYPDIQPRLIMGAQNEKNYNAAIEKLDGKAKTLEGYAELMNGASVDTIVSLNLSNPYYAAYGKVRGHKAGDLIGPMRGGLNNVVVASVIDVTESELPEDAAANERAFKTDAVRLFNMIDQQNPGFLNLLSLIRGDKKVEYNLHKFLNHQD